MLGPWSDDLGRARHTRRGPSRDRSNAHFLQTHRGTRFGRAHFAGPTAAAEVEHVAEEEPLARRNGAVGGKLRHALEDGLQVRALSECRHIEGRGGHGQEGREGLEGLRALRPRLQQVLGALDQQPGAQHAPDDELPDELHIAQSTLLAEELRLVVQVLVRAARLEQLFKGALAAVQKQAPELVGPILGTVVQGCSDPILRLQADAQVGIHGDEVMLTRRFLEDLAH
mmetsp:Transcript_82422/g.238061  ORF Transcript_82422/g.238061 Transcript_82422/m.238061 type:complete len:227 (-) Transcript_82422:673-1353(-)